MANKMADKKKNIGPSGTVEPKARSGEKEKVQSKEVKAVARERESRSAPRRENKGASPFARLLNNTAARFIRDSYHELRYKVTWPTFEEARNMTVAVLLLSTAVGVVLGIADLGLFQIFKLVTGH